jgi:hypothetical protein
LLGWRANCVTDPQARKGAARVKRNGSGQAAVDVEELVLAYLHRHPAAADTLEGIVRWWLPLQRREDEREHVAAALQALVRSGALRRDVLPDGRELYALQSGPEVPGNLLN